MPEVNGRLVLASASAIRRQLLDGAGLPCEIEPAAIDERAAMAGMLSSSPPLPPAGVAGRLAELKALDVAGRRDPKAWVIGADQTLELDGELLTKAADAEGGRAVLQRMRGRTHWLHSGVALAHERRVVWSTVGSAALSVREFTPAWLETYLQMAGDALTRSVGAYQLEGLGVQLFERIEGDYFTILGLPLLELLAALRERGVIAC